MQNWIFEIRSRSFVFLVIGFIVITLLVLFEITEEFDQSVADSFHQAAGNQALDLIMFSITETGDIFYMLGFGVLLIIIKKTRRIGITLMILLVLGTILTGYIKCGVDRDRPDLEFIGTQLPLDPSQDTYSLFCEGSFNASYPSGHATRAMMFGVVLGYALSARFPRGCYLLLIYPALISLSRIYVLQHFPMDVIGGIVLGALLAGIISHKTKLYTFLEASKT